MRRFGLILAAGAIALLGAASVAAGGRIAPTVLPGIVLAPTGSAAVPITVGGTHACALPGDGTVRCWGDNRFGQLGNGERSDPSDPAGDTVRLITVIAGEGQTAPLTGVSALAAGYAHTCALLLDTTVRCWGANEAIPDGGPFGPPPRTGGQVGDGTTAVRPAPVPVVAGPGTSAPLTNVTSISAGGDYTCAVLADSTISCWGNAPQGAGLVPVTVLAGGGAPLAKVVAVAAGDHHACALLADGTVACWGRNIFGELGADIGDSSELPVQVVQGGPGGEPLSDVIAITASHSDPFGPNGIASGHSCALLADQTVACWGVNDVGQIGNGASGEFDGRPWAGPVTAGGGSTGALSGVVEIAAGWAHTCAILTDGSLTCWGLYFGEPPAELGVVYGSGEPVQVLTGAAAVAAGSLTCSILTDGSVVCHLGADQLYEVPGLLVAAPLPSPGPPSAGPSPAPGTSGGPTVTEGPPASQGPGASQGPAAGPGGGSIATAPPAFADAVPTVSQISFDPGTILQSLAIAAAILLLIPFPGALFNNTLEANYEELSGNARRVRGRTARLLGPVGAALGLHRGAPQPIAGGVSSHADGVTPPPSGAPFWQSKLGIALFTVAIALMASLLDPAFWSRPSAIAAFAGMLGGLVVMLVVFNVASARAYRRHEIAFVIRALPGTIAIGLACLLISRITSFQPGYLYGLVIGLSAADTLAKVEDGRTAARGTLLVLLVAMASWLALGLLRSVAPVAADPGPAMITMETMLAAMVVAGLEGAAIGSLPLRYFGGGKMWDWKKLYWFPIALGAGALFFHILVNPASGYLADSTRTPLATIVGLLVAFAVGSGIFWAYFRYRPKGRRPRTAGHAS